MKGIEDLAPCSCPGLPLVMFPFVHSAPAMVATLICLGQTHNAGLCMGFFYCLESSPPRHAHGSLSTLLGHSWNVTSVRLCLDTLFIVPPSPLLFSSISPSLLPSTFLCKLHHLTHYVLLDSELSKGTHCNCLITAVFSAPSTRDDPQISVEKVNDEDPSSHQCPPNLPAHAQHGLLHVHPRLAKDAELFFVLQTCVEGSCCILTQITDLDFCIKYVLRIH